MSNRQNTIGKAHSVIFLFISIPLDMGYTFNEAKLTAALWHSRENFNFLIALNRSAFHSGRVTVAVEGATVWWDIRAMFDSSPIIMQTTTVQYKLGTQR